MLFWMALDISICKVAPFTSCQKQNKKMFCPLLWLRFTLEVIQIKIDFQISFQSEI